MRRKGMTITILTRTTLIVAAMMIFALVKTVTAFIAPPPHLPHLLSERAHKVLGRPIVRYEATVMVRALAPVR
jgi:hypothetical protein